MTWYYSDGKQQSEPIDETRLDELVAAGVVRDDTLVWREGMASWAPHASVRGPRRAAMVAPVAAPPEIRYCSECGNGFPASQLVTIGNVSLCLNCKPSYLQRMREGGQPVGATYSMRYAGFWIRFLARLIDGVLLGIVGILIRLPFGLAMVGMPVGGARPNFGPIFAILGVITVINLAINVAYEAYFLTTRGATLGKMALGLKVVTEDGGPITVGLAIGRYFAQILSAMIFFIGYIMAGFDDQKRSLHDRVCHTRVIHIR